MVEPYRLIIDRPVLSLIHLASYLNFTTLLYVSRFSKTRHNGAFLKIQILASMSSTYIPKALFCSYTNAVLQIRFELQS